MARYQFNGAQGSGWIDRSNGSSIPNDPDNVDFQRVLAWIAEGNTPDPPDPPPPSPDPPDFGDEIPDDILFQLAPRVQQARAFLANPSPNNAAILAALKLTIRLVLWLVARQVGRT